jgi:sarcosine oxidase subunit alpha
MAVVSGCRLAQGGRIDRTRPLSFSFDGKRLQGFAGDTIASALLASGVDVVARSFKYHRPRGIMAAGNEEANAFVRVGRGAHAEPVVLATTTLLVEGLEVSSLNAWPSLGFDVMGGLDRLARLIPPGFYYKSFIWPDWRLFEWAIRRSAGLGVAARDGADPDRYAHANRHCETLVVGAGLAGLTAAVEAAQSGHRVILIDSAAELGGRALWSSGALASRRAADLAASLARLPNVSILTSTTATGVYDHNLVAAVERAPASGFAERMWKIRAGEIIIASGAFERPQVFQGNDTPGVMLASAAREYVLRYGVAPGRRAVICAAGADGRETAAVLQRAGVTVVQVLDAAQGDAVLAVRGRRRVRAVVSNRGVFEADLLCVSGGWSPTAHLFSQAGGQLRFCDTRQMFVPAGPLPTMRCVGAAAGEIETPPPTATAPPTGRAFVDLASDVTAAGVALAARENYASVEHLKRYTTLGMGPDQGKTSNVNGLLLLGAATDRAPEAVGTTRFRPPFTPVRFGTIAGARTGELLRPRRYLPAHDWHLAQGALIEDYGWQRPDAYPVAGESLEQAADREALTVRNGVGLFDASPLGKIEVRGPDAGRLLDFIYMSPVSGLAVGRIRYGLMLTETGVVLDDGVCVRVAEDAFLVHTTSAGAERVVAWLDDWLQCEFPHFDCTIVDVTAQWATATLSGPGARAALEALQPGIDLSPAAFPHMTFRTGQIGGVSARIARVSFTGEASYEVSVPARYGASLMATAGGIAGVTPYGIEALTRLRIEKGYLHIGTDTDGTTLPGDVGFGRAAARRKDDFAGRRSLALEASLAEGRLQLVGLKCSRPIAPGAHVQSASDSDGYVTSACVSPTLNRPIALALLRDGRSRMGETLKLFDLGQLTTAEVVSPVFFDPEGVRLNA